MRTARAIAALAICVGHAAARADDVRVDVGVTGAAVGIPERGGGGMVVEIKGFVTDALAIGGRVEVDVMVGGVAGDDALPLDVAMAACGLVKAEYRLGAGPVRPFAGLGVGGYTIGGQTVDAGPQTSGIRSETGRYLGAAPQLGVDLGRVRLAATYHAILGATLEVRQTVGSVEQTHRLSQSWWALELSFRFGAAGRPARRPDRPAG